MRKLYPTLVLLFALFYFNNCLAQICPANGFSNSTSLFFYYEPGALSCAERPDTVTVDGSVFTLASCDMSLSIYDLTSGSPVSNINEFTVDFGSATCEYTSGDLTGETLSRESFESVINSLVVFPNPVLNNGNVNIVFGKNISANIELYAVTGKLILKDSITNLSRKQLSLSNIPNGVYLLKISTDTTSVTKKLIVTQ
ncbi:T9SS type A sorting domain-containing protein [Hanstruepera marina]|uniref:T9SS type A sorting domain-containing protein n=1 Tax=Hanstruepera marina TaxID=2873265 RepID=UPI001CA6DA81|nr:T9SS type A sorting domain-containing protein [Hanstruepera marina]